MRPVYTSHFKILIGQIFSILLIAFLKIQKHRIFRRFYIIYGPVCHLYQLKVCVLLYVTHNGNKDNHKFYNYFL